MINTVLTMKSKAIKVGVCSGRQQLAEFKEAWKRAERGLPPKEPVDRLYFPDAATMYRAFSRSRLQLLSVLRQRGTTSVLALAKALGRNYKNVYEDVKALTRFGLIHRVKRSVRVPFDSILVDAEIRLAAPESAVLYPYFRRLSRMGE